MPQPFGPETQAYRIIFGWSGDELASQLESFRAHHVAKGSRYVDWQQAWATWVNNDERFERRDDRRRAGARPSSPPLSLADKIIADEERRVARERAAASE